MTMKALSPGNETVELRLAEDADNRALLRLAGRDTRPLPPPPTSSPCARAASTPPSR